MRSIETTTAHHHSQTDGRWQTARHQISSNDYISSRAKNKSSENLNISALNKNGCSPQITTRATFETSNYPQRPWDRYTAPNSKCIGAEHPAPPPPTHTHPPPKKKKKKKWKTLNSNNRPGWKKMVALWNSLVTWKLAQYRYLSKVWKSNCQVFHLWLFCWYCSFAMCIPVRTNIHGSVAFPVLLQIDKENPHHYWNVVYRYSRFLRLLNS